MTELKYYFKRFWVYLLFLFLGIAILVNFNLRYKISNEMFLGGIATLLTLFFSVINYYQTSDRFFKELFTEFNKRYNDLNDLLNSITEGKMLIEKEKQCLVDYLNLCAEEYMWVTRGRIPVQIWNSWKNGIKFHLEKPQIREVFDRERALWKSSYYGFFEELDRS